MRYSKRIEIREKYDVVVCGGGFSGFAAAISARCGCSVSKVNIPELRALLEAQGADI